MTGGGYPTYDARTAQRCCDLRNNLEDPTVHVVSSTHKAFAYDAGLAAVVEVQPGDVVAFETVDARDGALLDRPPGQSFELPRPTPGKGNAVTGPVAVLGAQPVDAVMVSIESIDLHALGWCGAHAHVGPVPPGRVPQPVGRVLRIRDNTTTFGPGINLPLRPMVGCIATAPAGAPIPTALPGRHGGNMDQTIVTTGSHVLLPVFVDGGLLSVGDVHASQGDGELSGVALEAGSTVTTRLSLRHKAQLIWPWVITDDRVAVLVCGDSFEEARATAVDEMMGAIERSMSLTPGEALALLSIAGDLRIGQSYGAGPMTVRLEVPRSFDIDPCRSA